MEKVVVKRMAYSPRKIYDEHAHEETQITLVVSGSVEEKVGEHWQKLGPFEFVIKPAGLQHTNRFGEQETQTIQFSVGPNVAKRLGVASRLGVYHSRFCPVVTQRFLQVYSSRSFASVSSASGSLLDEIFRDVVVEIPKRRGSSRWLSAVAEQVDREYDRTVTLQGLAKQYRRHPVSIARAFRARFGQSIKQRVRQLRVQQAAKQLTETCSSAVSISQLCGFSDQSHMNRVFKSVTGMSPLQFRRLIHRKSG